MSDLSSTVSVESSDEKEDRVRNVDDRFLFQKELGVLKNGMDGLKRIVDNLKRKVILKRDSEGSSEYDKFVKHVDFFTTRCDDLCDRTSKLIESKVINIDEFYDLLGLSQELTESMLKHLREIGPG